jgi:hypothetical protein
LLRIEVVGELLQAGITAGGELLQSGGKTFQLGIVASGWTYNSGDAIGRINLPTVYLRVIPLSSAISLCSKTGTTHVG